MGIPAEIIRSMTGHHSSAVMDKYVKTNLTEKMEQIKKFDGITTPATPPKSTISADEQTLMNRIYSLMQDGDVKTTKELFDELMVLRDMK